MTFSLYAATVPVLTRQLNSLLRVIGKAEAYAAERKFDVNNFYDMRLAPDMHPFRFQVQSASDHAKFIVSRLTGKTPPSRPDDEKTVEELKARVQKALDYLATFTEADFAGADERDVTIRIAGQERTVKAQAYFLDRGQPNFYFHVTMAYAILRHGGVPVGKGDFLA